MKYLRYFDNSYIYIYIIKFTDQNSMFLLGNIVN